MRVGFIDLVCDPARPAQSGLSDVIWELGRALGRLGDEVHIAASYTVEPPRVPGIEVHHYPLPPLGRRNILGHILQVEVAWRRLCRAARPDVLIAPEYLSTGLLGALIRTPTVLVTPGNIYERVAHGNPFDWSTTQVYKLAARISARSCLLVDAISQEMAHWWRLTGVPESRLAVIPYGVDTDLFRPHGGARASLSLPASERVVVYAGRLSPEKRVETLLAALRRVTDAGVSLQAHLLGDGPQRPALQALAGAFGLSERVVFHGSVPRTSLPLWYSAADAVVLASASEGLPRVMLEAMACGAAFVGTRITGISDVIDDGCNGLLCPVGEEAVLADQLERVLSDASLRLQLGQQARSTILQSYTWNAVAAYLRAEVVRRLPVRPAVESA